MEINKYKQLLTTITAILLATMLLTACSDSDSDGSISGDSGSTIDNQDPTARPLIEKSINYEEDIREVITSGLEEHIYEFEVDSPSIINIVANPSVYGIYHERGSFFGYNLSPYFYFLDKDFNEIGLLQKNISSSSSTINREFKIDSVGTYYIIVSIPSEYDSQRPLLRLGSSTNQNEYVLTIQKQQIEDIIYGTPGNDIIRGSNKDQSIFGQAGNDIIYGTGGINHIYGGDGDDIIYSSLGKDELTGGAGRNKFVYTSINHSPANDLERDTIKDFDSNNDFIDLSSLPVFNNSDLYINNLPKNNNCSKYGYPTTSAMLWFDNSNSVLYGRYQVDGCGTKNANFSIALPGVIDLSPKNFIFGQ